MDKAKEGTALNPEVIVAGLRWDTVDETKGADLDLFCVLLDPDLRMLDAVRPGCERNENGSVVHTGDSTTGAGMWDDERVFIFLGEIPPSVDTIMLVVASASGEPLSMVPNASCDLSNHETDEALLHVPLSQVKEHSVHCVASLVRGVAGWRVFPGCPDNVHIAAILRRLGVAASSKWLADCNISRSNGQHRCAS